MEKDRSARLIAIVALVVGVLGLSIGFASFSENLKITSEANVFTNPDDFKIVFSTSPNSLSSAEQSGTPKTIEPSFISDGLAASTIAIDNEVSDSVPRVTDIVANFNAPGQSVVYTFYTVNNGVYDAFLKGLTASKVNENDYMICEKNTENGTDADAVLLKNACATITLTVKVDDLPELVISNAVSGDVNVSNVTGENSNITGHKLLHDTVDNTNHIGGNHKITLTIAYGNTAERVDGDFKVTFGDINLSYSSVD